MFQTNFSGRAEIGLTGDDDFHFRVSEDGSQFRDNIILDKQTGRANFPSGFAHNGVSSETLTSVQAQAPVLSGPSAVRFHSNSLRLGWQG